MELPIQNTELLDLMNRVDAFLKKNERSRRLVSKTQAGILQKARKILADMGKKEERLLLRIESVMKRHEKLLQDSLGVMQNVDETLCNVLLAIRQNEYLQAWYPPQNGQPAQAVVGKYVVVDKKALQ